ERHIRPLEERSHFLMAVVRRGGVTIATYSGKIGAPIRRLWRHKDSLGFAMFNFRSPVRTLWDCSTTAVYFAREGGSSDTELTLQSGAAAGDRLASVYGRRPLSSQGRGRIAQAGRMLMKKIGLVATLVAVSVGPSLGPSLAQTMDEILNDGRNTDNVITLSMGLDRKSYSPLNQINKSNVRRLVPVWSTSLMNDMGELAAPVV